LNKKKLVAFCLREIPNDIGFEQLEYFDLSYNIIKKEKYCFFMKYLENLKVIDLRGNPFVVDKTYVVPEDYPKIWDFMSYKKGPVVILGEPKDLFLNQNYFLMWNGQGN
jgi:hypothetical protein